MESKSNSFNCIIEGKRCTLGCEDIHLPMQNAVNAVKGRLHDDDIIIKKYWRRISKRKAKKINPRMFSNDVWSDGGIRWVNQEVGFFKCLALKNGVCTVYEDRPDACKDFTGHGFYNTVCSTDYYANIFDK